MNATKKPSTKGTKLKRYSAEELKLIREMVEKFPLNLDHAFKVVAHKTGRSAIAISQKWYSDMKHHEPTMLATISKTSITKNRKNMKYEVSNYKVETIVKLFEKLDYEEKVEVLKRLPEEERFAIIIDLF